MSSLSRGDAEAVLTSSSRIRSIETGSSFAGVCGAAPSGAARHTTSASWQRTAETVARSEGQHLEG